MYSHSLLRFLFLGWLVSLINTHNHSFKFVCLCHTTSLSLCHSYHLFTVASAVLPLSLAMATPQFRRLSFQMSPLTLLLSFGSLIFGDDCSYLFLDVTHIWYQYENGSNVKKACMQRDHVHCFLWISPTRFQHILVVPFEFDWTQASPQIAIQSTVPLSLCSCVSLNSMVTLAQSSCCAAKIKCFRNSHCCHGNNYVT